MEVIASPLIFCNKRREPIFPPAVNFLLLVERQEVKVSEKFTTLTSC